MTHNFEEDSKIFYCVFKNGEAHGEGKEKRKTGFYYTGRWRTNQMTGPGKQYYPNGKLNFEGDFVDGNWTGKGCRYDLVGLRTMEGEVRNGSWNGYAMKYVDDGCVTEG